MRTRLWGAAVVLLAGLAAYGAFGQARGGDQAADSAGIVGGWTGTWTKNGDALPVTVTFESSPQGLTGHFDSDALQVAAIPFREVSATLPLVHFVLAGDSTTTIFDGTLNGGVIEGSLAEGATKGSFRMVRERAMPSAISSSEVTFADGSVALAGSLLLPAGAGPHPAIVFLQGSGPEGRWANRYLAERFAKAGFAALIYDKRGVGQSTGDWHTSGFDELAGDAAAAVRFLRDRSEIDGAKIGIYGHSQGGTLAPLAALRAGHLAFVIGSASGGIDPAEMEEYSVGNSIGVNALPQSEAAEAKSFVHAIVDVAFRGKPRDELNRSVAEFKGRPWYFDPPPPESSYWSFSRLIAGYDPAVYWRQVKAPVLLLFGEKDERVPPDRSSRTIIAALHAGGNDDVTLKTFPDADHTFELPAKTGGWPKHVADYADILTAWALSKIR